MPEDSEAALPPFEKISAEDINLYFDQFFKFKECESCGAVDWFGSSESKDGFVPAIVSVSKDRTLDAQFPIFPVVTMVCQNCGFMRLYSRMKIESEIARLKTA